MSHGATGGSTASLPGWASRWRRRRSGRSSRAPGSTPRRAAPRRDGPGWAEFPRPQAQGILAPGFFTAGLLDGAKVHVLAVIEHGTRRIRVLGATEHPAQAWVARQARNLLMDLEDTGFRVKFVLHDRDASFTAAFDAVFQAAGARVIRPAARAPRMNSIMGAPG